MNQISICIVGDVTIDVTLKTISSSDYKLRFGGIIHAARGLWSQDVGYSVYYNAPAYLDRDIYQYLSAHGCLSQNKIGNIIGAPYIFLIEEVKEVGNQGYEFLLRDKISFEYIDNWDKHLIQSKYSDFLFFSGNYDLPNILDKIQFRDSNVHLDYTNNAIDLQAMQGKNIKFKTIFLSTSSELFKLKYDGDFERFANIFVEYTEILILKENRGGIRAFNFKTKELFRIPSQTRPIVHSVGVGDVFDATFIAHYQKIGIENALYLASWIAVEYASTTFPDDLRQSVRRVVTTSIDSLKRIGGVSVPWEIRQKINVYIAAPDFDFLNTKDIDLLCASLEYHNFRPRRPIQENGQMEPNATKARRASLYQDDIKLLQQCDIVIAVLINHDPGTYIEIGLAHGMQKPVLVYDPYSTAQNCMLTELPKLVSSNLDEILSEVFIISNKLFKNE